MIEHQRNLDKDVMKLDFIVKSFTTVIGLTPDAIDKKLKGLSLLKSNLIKVLNEDLYDPDKRTEWIKEQLGEKEKELKLLEKLRNLGKKD